MSSSDFFWYEQGRREGTAAALAHTPQEPSWLRPLGQGQQSVALEIEISDLKSDFSALEEKNSRLEERSAALSARNAALEQALEDTRRRLNAARAVRDTLRNALAQVAPDHQYVNPLSKNPLLVSVAEAGYQADLEK